MQIWPQGAWFGLTTKRIRKISFVLVSEFVTIGLFLAIGMLYFRYEARLAKHLLQDVQELQIGQSTTNDVMRIAARYHAHVWTDQECTGGCIAYFFEVEPISWLRLYGHGRILDESLIAIYQIFDTQILNNLGIRAWQVMASVTLKNGKVSTITGHMFVEGSCHKWLDAGWRMAPEFPQFWMDQAKEAHQPPPQGILIHWHHLHMGPETGEGLEAAITPSASAQEFKAAVHLNTNCLWALGKGCFLLSDIFPDGVGWQRDQGRSPLGWTSQTCKGLKDP